jgi:septal ring factor EnvC (AmiA/AmiB activator)
VIATAGNSGGYSQTGVYFEIRKDAKPLDPRKWCKGS